MVRLGVIQSDRWTKQEEVKRMAGNTIDVKSIIGLIVVIVVALAMTPMIMEATTTAAASLTGASSTLVGLIPLFYIIGILMAAVVWAVGKAK